MPKTKCQEFKNDLERINFYFDKFNELLSSFKNSKNSLDRDRAISSTRRINENLHRLGKDVEQSFTDTPNGKKFKIHMWHTVDLDCYHQIEANFRKQIKLKSFNRTIKVGDVINAEVEEGHTEKGCTVEGFEVRSNKVICSVIKSSFGGMRKKKKYILLSNLHLQ